MIEHSKSIEIPIKNIKEYNLSLKENYFDPTKQSPQNNFIYNLENRYKNYYNN